MAKKSQLGFTPRVLLRDELGRFMPHADRFKGEVETVQVIRRGKVVTLWEGGGVNYEGLAVVLTRDEWESLPPALEPIKELSVQDKKQAAWDLATQLDKTPRVRRKLLKITLNVRDGKRLRKIHFHTKINRNSASSYRIFQQINEALQHEGMFTYKTLTTEEGETISIPDRRGRKIELEGMDVEEVL